MASQWLEARPALRRSLRYYGLVAAAGLTVLPLLVYLAGVLTLGPYDGGLPAFLRSLYGAFFGLRPAAWLLLLGPCVLFGVLRALTRPLRRRGSRAAPTGPAAT
jgi:hypothetical protein